MLTGYKIKGEEIAVDTSSKINQRTSNHFKPISGNTFENNKGQLKVLPNTDNSYYKSSEEGYACYGSSTYGGSPDIELTAPGTYYFKFTNTSDRLLLQYGNKYSGKNLSGPIVTISSYKMYNGYFPKAVKLWFAICGGGGGGYYSNGPQFREGGAAIGGGGAGSCVFSWTITDYDTMLKFVIGSGGRGGYERWLKVVGDDPRKMDSLDGSSGGDTIFSVGNLNKGSYEFSNMITCHGGRYRSRIASTCDGSAQYQTHLFYGGFSGGSGGTGQFINWDEQASAEAGSVNIQNIRNNDYSAIYDLLGETSIYTQGGDGGGGYIAGGGGCGFFNSVAGNRTRKNGTLGSGGCSINATADGAGQGGNGACHIWVSGSNHYEVNDDVTACITPIFNLGTTVFLFPYDLNSNTVIEITYYGTGPSSVTETKTVDSWKTFILSGEARIISAIIKSI